MGLMIESGTGNGSQAKVTDDNRLDVSSRENPRIAYIAKDDGQSYTWSHAYNYDANDTILLVSNSSATKNLYIHTIAVGSDTATRFTIHSPAYPTLAGSVVTGTNTNRTSGNAADAEAYGDETGNTQANVIASGMIPATGTAKNEPNGTIVLGYHKCIAVDLVTAGSMGTVTISGYYE